jgi:DNA polymerase-3 subunit delta'
LAPCGKCPSCKKILSCNHPDIISISSAGPIIKVDQVRALCARLALKPYEARKRFAIIPEAHKLNAEAGNTLLKILEEPPGHTVFILTAPQASDLLPTIVSRCRQLHFHPLPLESVKAYVQDTHGIDSETAAVVAAMAGGSMTRADAIAKSGWIARRNWIIEELEALPDRPVNLCLAFSEVLTKNRQWLFTAFEIMKSWLRDMVVCQYAPHRIINQDLSEQLNIRSKKAGIKDLLQKIKAIEKAEKDIQSNANLKLTMDLLVLSLAKG